MKNVQIPKKGSGVPLALSAAFLKFANFNIKQPHSRFIMA